MLKTHWIIADKEILQILHSQRGLLGLLIFSCVLSAFSLLLVSDTELSLLDNAQVVYLMTATVMAAGALLAVILGSDAYAGEKERGTLVPLLCAPVSPAALLCGKTLGLLGAWVVMYVTAAPYFWSVGAAGQNLGAALLYLALFGTPVVLGFGLLAMAMSARTGSVLSSLLSTVSLLLVMSSPLWIGPGLRQTVIGRIMDAINPFAGALNTFDSVIIDSQPLSMQAGRLALVVLWLGLCWLAARRGADRPTFS